jgi:sec-independent protein translocase protein TatB
MFDLGFPEILMVVIVALVVLGPKRMPQLVRQVGRWVGKARAMARQFREQLESEIDIEDLATGSKRSTTASTPAPIPELTGGPIAENQPTSEDGTYPYGSYPYAEPPTSEPAPAAPPQPGDDTYSHAHADGDAPMPYLPPEAEGFGQPVVAAEPAAANHPHQPKDSSAA